MTSKLDSVTLNSDIAVLEDVKLNKKGIAKDKRDRVAFEAAHDGGCPTVPFSRHASPWHFNSLCMFIGKHGHARKTARDVIDT